MYCGECLAGTCKNQASLKDQCFWMVRLRKSKACNIMQSSHMLWQTVNLFSLNYCRRGHAVFLLKVMWQTRPRPLM